MIFVLGMITGMAMLGGLAWALAYMFSGDDKDDEYGDGRPHPDPRLR